MVLAEDAAVGSTVLEVVAHLCNLSLPALYEINRGFATAEMVNVLRTGSLVLWSAKRKRPLVTAPLAHGTAPWAADHRIPTGLHP